MAVTGFISVYPLLILAVAASGLGVASFHPEGFKTAHFFTGEKKATGMSYFRVGGNLGMALGPILGITPHYFLWNEGDLRDGSPGNPDGSRIFSFPSHGSQPPFSSLPLKPRRRRSNLLSREEWTSLLFLIGVVIMRSWTQLGLVTYIPFYYIDYLKGDPLYAGKLVSTFMMAGVVGTLVGSPLADRWGHKRFLSISMLLTVPLLLSFTNPVVSLFSSFLEFAGMILISSFTVTVVMAQALLPRHLGMASGLMVGFAVGTGGIGVTLLGTIADHWGVPDGHDDRFFSFPALDMASVY